MTAATLNPAAVGVDESDRRPMLSYAGLSKYIGIGLRTCKRWVAEGVLPPPDLRLRGIVRWNADTIDRWLARHRREQR